MTVLLDAVLIVPDYPATARALAAIDPARVIDGEVSFGKMPAQWLGSGAGRVYLARFTPEVAARWRAVAPQIGVEIVAEHAHAGEGQAAAQAALAAMSPEAVARARAIVPDREVRTGQDWRETETGEIAPVQGSGTVEVQTFATRLVGFI